MANLLRTLELAAAYFGGGALVGGVLVLLTRTRRR